MSEDTLSNQPTSLIEGVPWDQLQTIDVGAATHPSTRLQPGMCLGDRYIVEDLLGEGGMGEVWLVQDRLEQRRVALKRIRWAGPTNFDELERAASRARLEFFAMKRLKHPGTVEVYDCGFLSSGDRYFTMEVVSGQDLGDLVAPGERLGEERALEIIIEVVEILAFISRGTQSKSC